MNAAYTALVATFAVIAFTKFLGFFSPADEKKQGGSSITKILMGGMFVAVAVGVFANGNPSQRVDKLFTMMSRGMAGGEDAKAFDKLYKDVGSNDQHNAYDADVANSFYNLATEFYEYGWGDSFHFGVRHQSDPHVKALANTQHFVAQKLGVKDMDKVLDMGCGIGGPLRGIVKATGANITGLTINKHQVRRAREITKGLSQWMQDRCHFEVQDYLDIKGMPLNHYDAAFYMESSLHCENRTKTFKLLKPGGRLVAMEYTLLPGWQPENPVHKELMRLHLHGNGAAKTPTIAEDLAMVRAAGFEIKEHYDYMSYSDQMYGDEAYPWWQDLQFNLRFHLLPAHPWVRNSLPPILRALSAIGLVPEDVPKAAELMNMGGDGLSGLGKENAITPQYFVLGVKPLK
jgi:sterol 24-C-methyltransferase